MNEMQPRPGHLIPLCKHACLAETVGLTPGPAAKAQCQGGAEEGASQSASSRAGSQGWTTRILIICIIIYQWHNSCNITII